VSAALLAGIGVGGLVGVVGLVTAALVAAITDAIRRRNR
jgi:hypothetical protein